MDGWPAWLPWMLVCGCGWENDRGCIGVDGLELADKDLWHGESGREEQRVEEHKVEGLIKKFRVGAFRRHTEMFSSPYSISGFVVNKT